MSRNPNVARIYYLNSIIAGHNCVIFCPKYAVRMTGKAIEVALESANEVRREDNLDSLITMEVSKDKCHYKFSSGGKIEIFVNETKPRVKKGIENE